MGKTNPRRQPCTQADVDRAWREGRAEGIERGIQLMLFCLADRHEIPAEELRQFAAEIDYTADSVAKGYINWSDVAHMLKELGIKVHLR